MHQRLRIVFGLLAAAALFLAPSGAMAQGVTTGAISGIVKDAQGLAVPGSTVLAVHQPSGSTYEAVSREDGRFSIPGMRVGGPYTVTASLEGFQPSVTSDVFVNLGVAADLTLTLRTVAVSETVTVVAESDAVFSSARTGASTAIARETLAALPTNSNRLADFTRLTPQAAGTSFGGVDNRLNNITVDGSYFNNSFGLGGSPGDRTGVAPISLSAIEAVQVNIAPYDVRQGNFVGAGVNTVTRSGGNSFRGSAFYQWRNESLVGTEAKGLTYNPGTFDFHNGGGWVSGPIVKNKAFFFFNFEDEANTYPGTTFKANNGSETVAGNTTRVLASDLQALSAYMKSKFGYETGPYEGYQFETPARRYLIRGDYNLNQTNKVSVRYNQLDSNTDVLLSNSSSLGFGNRRSNLNALNFESSNYQIKENIRSFIGEWNGAFGGNKANTLIVGYTKQDESRDVRYPTLFPLIDILKDGSTYTSIGYEPFTPNNELRYNTFQVQDSFTMFLKGHSLTFGASYEKYRSENVFFPGKQSAYVYNSLADFYTDANDFLANPNRTVSPVTARTFQVRWNNIPGAEKPLQPLEVQYTGVYAQDVWQAKNNFSLTYGIRFDVPVFGDTGYANAVADAMTFMDEKGDMVQYLDRETARPDVPLVASRGLQLGRVRESQHADPRRHGHLHGQARLRLDLQPDRQYRRADRVRVALEHDRAALQSRHRALQADKRDRRPGVELRTRAHRSQLQVPPGVADEHRRRSAAAWRLGRDARIPLQQGRQRRVLHQRQSDESEHRVHRRRHPATVVAGRYEQPHQSHGVERHRHEEPGRRDQLEHQRQPRTHVPHWPLPQGRVPLRTGVEHGGPRVYRVRLVEQQPALGEPEPAGRGVLGLLSGAPRVRGGQLHV